VQTRSRRSAQDFFGTSRLGSERYDDLSRTAVLLVVVWAASVVVLGGSYVLQDAGARIALSILGLAVFFLGLNVWLAAVVVGLFAVVRGRWRPLLRAPLLVALLVLAVVAVFVASGMHLGEGDDAAAADAIPTQASNTTRGLALWAVAVEVALLSARLLRMQSVDEDAPDGRRYRQGLVAARLLVLALVVLAGLGWAHHAARPGVVVINDGDDVVSLQLCPQQGCSGRAHRLAPGSTHRFTLRPAPADGEPTEPLRVTSDGALLGCLPLLYGPDLRQVGLGVSQARQSYC
jgi:hypothetical protein